MRKFMILNLIAVCAVLMGGNLAVAVDKDSGGGKNNKKYKIHMKNMEHELQVCCWMRPKGTKRPTSHREWKAAWRKIDGKGSAHAEVRGGWYECTVIDKGTKKDASHTFLIHMDKDRNYCCDRNRIWEDGKRPPRPPKSGKSGKGGGKGKGGKGKGGKDGGKDDDFNP